MLITTFLKMRGFSLLIQLRPSMHLHVHVVEIAHTLPSQLPFKSHSPLRRLCLPKIPHKKIIGIVLSQLLGFDNKIVIHGIKGIAICCGIHAVENVVINAYGFIVNLFFRMPA